MHRTCLALALLLPAAALAHAPGVDITSPTAAAVVYVNGFPAVVPITATIKHGQNDPEGGASGASLSDLRNLRVTVDDDDVPTAAGNPFPDNACNTDQLTAALGWAGCLVSSSIEASVTASWTVEDPGVYAVAVLIRHGGAQGSDEETVEVQLLSVEYPAPPAVANAYIREHYKRITGGCRGHIISRIANKHAMLSWYGLKGGPYDESLIRNDVTYYYDECT